MSAEMPGVGWIAAVQAILGESFSVNDAQTHG